MANSFAPLRIAVVTLWAERLPETVHFYRDVLGMELALHAGHQPHFRIGETVLVIMPGRPQVPPDAAFPVVAFEVGDLAPAVVRLEAHNVAMPWGVEAGEDSRWVKFYDPAGNLVELVQWRGQSEIAS
jgi:catechol 2,3-dioxygenase-like lactoylglutathione lyase family enzyme